MIFIIVIGIFLVSGITFWLPYRQEKKTIAFLCSISLAVLLGLILIPTDGIFFVIFLYPIVSFAIIFIVYWALISFGLKKVGKITAIFFSILAILPILSIAFEDFLFFKSDAKVLLKENDIELLDNFTIKSNQIIGMKDVYQKFELEISENDKKLLVKKLRQSRYFKDSAAQGNNLREEMQGAISKKIFRDYKQSDTIRRERYEKPKQGYISTFDVITISENNNILTFEREQN